MTAAPGPSPQQIRERLLQAVDPSSNIRNMDAVLEVISSLEKYPITKEALEETRLGKLINDVRKKTENEELAKRAKKLLRNWQKLIEPIAQNDAALRGLPNVPGSANGGAHNCRTETPPGPAVGPKPIQNVKSRNDIQKLHSPKPGNRKRKGEARDHLQGPPVALAKVSKVSCDVLHNSSPPPTNGIGGSPESFPILPDGSTVTLAQEGDRVELNESDKLCKIPINAVRPHTSSPGAFKPSGPLLLKTPGLPHEKVEETATSQPWSPQCASFSPRHVRLETLAWQQTASSPKGLTPSRSPRLPLLDTPAAVPSSPPSSPQAILPPPMKKLETSQPAVTEGLDRQVATPESQVRLSAGASHLAEMSATSSGFSPEASTKADSDGTASGSESRKKKKHRGATDCLDGSAFEGGFKPVRLKKERRLTFDPMTGEIKPLAQRDTLPADLPALSEPHRTGAAGVKPDPELPLPSPFEQTNWKELSRNEIIQSYLNRQSSLLSSSGVQTPGAHYFMSEYLKQEESTRREARKSHVLAPHGKPSSLPGVTREVMPEDLDRISCHHWPGVNGCYDTQGNWYDWTQCIALDPHGDDGHLNVLPYVCLD